MTLSQSVKSFVRHIGNFKEQIFYFIEILFSDSERSKKQINFCFCVKINFGGAIINKNVMKVQISRNKYCQTYAMLREGKTKMKKKAEGQNQCFIKKVSGTVS